jgi:hypothetical protein
MPNSMASHTHPEKMGTIQKMCGDKCSMFAVWRLQFRLATR